MESADPSTVNGRVAIGPLWSDWGFKVWNLVLDRHQIVAYPYTTAEAIKLGFHLAIGWPADPGEIVRTQPSTVQMLDRGNARYYPISELCSVAIDVNYGNNQIVLQAIDGRYDRYNIYRRENTDNWRDLLSKYYPARYTERGIPKSAFGRFLKW